LVLTPKQLCLIAALASRSLGVIKVEGKESGRVLLSEHVTVLEQKQDRGALTQSTQATLSRLETAITLESYRVMFVTMNYTDAGLEAFKAALKAMFPTCERSVCTLWDYNNQPAGKLNDLGFRVYVPVSAGPPSIPFLLELVDDLKGIQFDHVSECWLGERTAANDDNWTLLV